MVQFCIWICSYIILEYELEALQSLDAALEMLKLGKIERAQKLFEHALALSPKHPDVLNNYGEFMEYTQKDIIHADHLYFKVFLLGNYYVIY